MISSSTCLLSIKCLITLVALSDSAYNAGDRPVCEESYCNNVKFEYKPRLHNVCEYLLTPVSKEVPHRLYSSGGVKEYLCDTQTDGGRWMIIQSRKNKSTSFSRNWEEYKKGFGSSETDYWLGNEFIHQLTSQENHELRVEMKFRNTSYLAEYGRFQLVSEDEGYALTLDRFDVVGSNVWDALGLHNGSRFSTEDRDQDELLSYNCAQEYRSGWWYQGCFAVNLHAPFATPVPGEKRGLYWEKLTPSMESLSEVQLKIRSTEQ